MGEARVLCESMIQLPNWEASTFHDEFQRSDIRALWTCGNVHNIYYVWNRALSMTAELTGKLSGGMLRSLRQRRDGDDDDVPE